MKKQINPTIKAHLIRGAFYLLLLLAVCAIPFALAQRNAAKQSVPKPPIKPDVATNTYLAQPGQYADGVVRAPVVSKVVNALFGHHTGLGQDASALGNNPLLTYMIDDRHS